VGKRKRGKVEDVEEPSTIDRIFSNRYLTIGLGALIVLAFAGLGILIVTLLGGADPGSEGGLRIPDPVGPPVAIERSAAADLLESKTWDDMTAEERTLVQAEVVRVFDDSTFRASNDFVPAVDIFRTGGATLASRLYREFEAAGGKDTATHTIFYCDDGNGGTKTYRYIVSSVGNEMIEGKGNETPPAFSPIFQGASWDNARDLGWRETHGLKIHGLELGYTLPGSAASGEGEPREYWFDVESARLIEWGLVFPDDPKSTEANWYRLRYDELAPPQVPDGLEQPQCVQDILATVAP
jgi:hypothetical protein